MSEPFIRVCMPGIRLKASTNAREGHWAPRSSRAASQRYGARLTMQGFMRQPPKAPGYRIRMTRIAQRQFDDDNLAAALKHIRDGIADWLGINDGSDTLLWQCADVNAGQAVYGVLIEVWERTEVEIQAARLARDELRRIAAQAMGAQ